MTETTEAKPSSERERPRRARWQSVLGVGLIGVAVLMALRSLLAPWIPSMSRRAPEPIPLRLPADLKPGQIVPSKTGEFGGCNLLLVTFDTTRADRVGCYGNANIETPNLDLLAHEGVLFSQAVAPAPVTLASHSSMLTGLYPYHHGARANTLSMLDEKPRTLGEILSAKGYAAAAFVSAFVLDPQFGTARGFSEYDANVQNTSEFWEAVAERSADKTCDLALSWLAEHSNEPFFLWVHFFDPHWAYSPPSPFAERYKSNPYDGEIAFADSQLGRLLASLDEHSITEKTLVVAAGDHGEGLLQHDETSHGCLIFDSTLKVPLIMRCGKRLGAGLHVDRLVCLVDIMPTVLSMLGIKEQPEMDGIDLTRPADGPRSVFIETMEGRAEYGWAALLGVRTESAKYIHGPNPALYDLVRDPNEKKNEFAARADLASNMQRQVSGFFGSDLEKAASLEPTTQLSPGDMARLESLGYVGAAGTTDAVESPPDPIEMMPLLRKLYVAFDPSAANWLDRVIAEMEVLAREYPNFYLVHRELVTAYAKKGDMAKAEAAIKRCLELRPRSVIPLFNMASLKDQQGDYRGAIQYYRQVVEFFPDHVPTLTRLGQLLLKDGAANEAAACLKRAHEIIPKHEEVCIAAADALAAAGRAEEALEVLRQTLALDAKLVRVRNKLAHMLKAQGRPGEAASALREGLKLMPDRLDLAANLAITLLSSRDPNGYGRLEAVAIMERVCEKTDYKHPEFLQALSRAYAAAGRIDEAISTAEKAQRLAREFGRNSLVEAISRDMAVLRKARADSVTPTSTTAPAIGQ